MSHQTPSQTSCPKCHVALPQGLYERADSICPACGLVFAKYRAAQNAAYRQQIVQRQAAHDDASWLNRLLAVPERVSTARFYAGLIGFMLFLWWGIKIALLDYRTGTINQSFLHGVLLVFHEAGHVIFRLFGEFTTVLGGTLAQLLMPIVLMIALLRHNHDTLGASLGLWLLGISLLDVAPYMYDALTPQLILLNGVTGEDGGHDWIYILGKLGMLHHAHGLGGMTYFLGVLTLLASALWAAVLLKRQWHIKSQAVGRT